MPTETPKRFASVCAKLEPTLVLGEESREADQASAPPTSHQASAAPTSPKPDLDPKDLNPALIRMVMDTGVSKDKAVAALLAYDGDTNKALASLESSMPKTDDRPPVPDTVTPSSAVEQSMPKTDDRPPVLDTVTPLSAAEQSKVINKAAGKGKGKGRGRGRGKGSKKESACALRLRLRR